MDYPSGIKAGIGSPLAIIPARGGSQRVPRKNLHEVLGKPLLAHAIEVARESCLFASILVNSDDPDILAVGRQWGAEVYQRPPQLGEATSYVIDVLREMLANLGLADAAAVGILLPTNPLRTAEDLRAAWRIFQENGQQAPVVSVGVFETPIQLAHWVSERNRLVPYFPTDYRKTSRSTGHKEAFRYNGAIIFNNVGTLKQQENLIGDEPIPYFMPNERSVDIDHPFQLELVKLLMAQRIAQEKAR